MQVREFDINSIKPFPDNPRRIENGIEKVAESIRQFGFKNPIIIDKNGYIIAGHVRYEAAKEIGLKKVPVIIADDLTEDQTELFRIVDNKTGELAGWDFLALEKELQEIRGIDMSAYGEKGYYKRAIWSTWFGQLFDDYVFVFLAFAPFGISAIENPWTAILTVPLISAIVETGIETIVTPISKKICDTVKAE